MHLPQNPFEDDGPPKVISIGTFVAVRIDPVATLAPLEDAEVNFVARMMEPKTYVALVTRRQGWSGSSPPLLELELTFVGPELQNSLYTPLSPNSNSGSRAPVQPSKPLPWSDCCLHSLTNKTVRISHIDRTNDSRILLSRQDTYRVMENSRKDRQEDARTIRKNEVSEPDSGAVGSISNPDSHGNPTAFTPQDDLNIADESASPSNFILDIDFSSEDYDSHSHLGSGSEEPGSPTEATDPHILDAFFAPAIEITANLYLDLSLAPELLHPQGFLDEISEIRRLKREAEQRLAAELKGQRKRLRIAKWVREDGQSPIPPSSGSEQDFEWPAPTHYPDGRPVTPPARIDPALLSVTNLLSLPSERADTPPPFPTSQTVDDQNTKLKPLPTPILTRIRIHLREILYAFQRHCSALLRFLTRPRHWDSGPTTDPLFAVHLPPALNSGSHH